MSNVENDSQPIEVDASPADGGQAVAETTPTFNETEAPAELAEPEYDYLDIDDTLASKHVRIKVDGEELTVPLKEALQGYQRQEAFTRKTQETARLRQEAQEALRLQQAFQTSPGLTVQVLASQAGVTVEEFLGMTPAQQQAAIQDPEPEYTDPLERAIADERQARLALQERIEAREADEYLRARVEGLKQTYQITDEEVREVVGQALQMGVGPEAFPMIYQAQAYQKLQAAQQAQQEVTTRTAAEEAQRQAAAAAAARTVTSGSGATNVTSIPSANGITTPRDAVLAAFESLEAGR
jgi:hypothetical protein